jgi:hypothetical protein
VNVSESVRDEIARVARWTWTAHNRLISPFVAVDVERGLVAVSCVGRSAAAGRVVLLDLADGAEVKSLAFPGYPSSLLFVDDWLVVRANKRVDVLDLNRDLTLVHRFGSTGDTGSLVVVSQHTLLAIGRNDAVFLDLKTHETTKRRPGKRLGVLNASFGPLIDSDGGQIWRPLPNHTFVPFSKLGGDPVQAWLDCKGRLWVTRDRPPNERWTPSGEHLDVYTVTDDGVALDWSRQMNPESGFLRRNDGLWLIDRSGRVVQPTRDGDENIEGDPLLEFVLARDATSNYNITSYAVGVLAKSTDGDSHLARLA